jgi:hypothetical protein
VKKQALTAVKWARVEGTTSELPKQPKHYHAAEWVHTYVLIYCKGRKFLPLTVDGQWLWIVAKYSEGVTWRRDDKWSRPWTCPSRHPSPSSLCPSVWTMLPTAHHPSTESDTTAFYPPRMGRFSV